RGVGDRGAAGTRAAACDRRRPSRGGGVVAGTRGTGGTSASAPGRRGAGGTSATVEMDRVRRPGAALATGPKPCAGEPAGLAAVGRDRDRVAGERGIAAVDPSRPGATRPGFRGGPRVDAAWRDPKP